MTADTREWLTGEVEGMADTFLRLKRELKIKLGNPKVRASWREARNRLRLAIARRVWDEHPHWEQVRRIRELMTRERYALEQATIRLDGDPGEDR